MPANENNAPNNGANPLASRLDAVKILLDAFKMERILYVVISCISVGVLLAFAIITYNNNHGMDFGTFAALFVPTGAISLSIAQILRMWNQAIKFVNGQTDSGDGK